MAGAPCLPALPDVRAAAEEELLRRLRARGVLPDAPPKDEPPGAIAAVNGDRDARLLAAPAESTSGSPGPIPKSTTTARAAENRSTITAPAISAGAREPDDEADIRAGARLPGRTAPRTRGAATGPIRKLPGVMFSARFPGVSRMLQNPLSAHALGGRRANPPVPELLRRTSEP